MSRKLFKLTAVGAMSVLLVMGVAYCVVAAPTQDDFLLCVEVDTADGVEVYVSVPPSLLDTLYDVLPHDIKRICEELEVTPSVIVNELTLLDGEDLVSIEGANNIRVWMEPVTEVNRIDLGFIRIYVTHGDDDSSHEINLNLPRGLVQLAGRVIKQLNLVDHFVQVPEEIKALSVNSSAD